MTQIVPYPLLAVGLVLFWLLLGGFTPGQLVLAVLAAVELASAVFYDIIRSNIAVARLVVLGRNRRDSSGFIVVSLKLREPSGLALLAIILTATPGSAWLDYSHARGELLIHVFDLVDEDAWRETICNRYERLLLEIFA
jgi:multicomponent K+:H+ antiporter subunit E